VQATGAELMVMTSVPDAVTWGTVRAPSAAGDIQALIADSEQGFRTLLDEAFATLPESLGAKKVVGYGPAGPAIVKQVDAGGHDLVVMGSRGLGAWSRLLLGSVSSAVVHHAKCSVEIVRTPETQKPDK